MQVVFHIGAHAADRGKLLKSLFRNKGLLSKHGVVVTGPGRYRKLLQEMLGRLDGAVPSPQTRELLLDAIVDEDDPKRIILSNDSFINHPRDVLEDQILYPGTTAKVMALSNLFPDAQIEFFLGLCNPATFIPALRTLVPKLGFYELTHDVNPTTLRWSHMVRRLREANPEARLTVWCNEDTPLIWGQILREITAVGPRVRLGGDLDLMGEIMSRDGMQRFQAYLQSHPPRSDLQKRRIMAAFLDKFALPEEIEQELDAPGWTDELVAELTDLYDEDIAEIERMSGVNFIAP